jgi:hypothetical protein
MIGIGMRRRIFKTAGFTVVRGPFFVESRNLGFGKSSAAGTYAVAGSTERAAAIAASGVTGGGRMPDNVGVLFKLQP